MNITIPIATILASGIILMVGLSVATDHGFGTKVVLSDNDLGRLLKNIPDGTIIGFWDTGPNVGVYDGEDIVYLDTPPVGIVNANELRLTPFKDNYAAGTKVTPNDKDINAPLKIFNAEIRFLNLNGSHTYDLYDPVYIHQLKDQFLNMADKAQVDEPTIHPVTNRGTTAKTSTVVDIVLSNSTVISDSMIYSPAITDRISAVYPSKNSQKTAPSMSKYHPIINEGFHERFSNTGNCNNLPLGATCLTYSDNFVWTVSDYQIDNNPCVVGFDNNGRPIEMICCNNADYYHILGTIYVNSIPRQKTLFIQSSPNQYVTNTGDYTEKTSMT